MSHESVVATSERSGLFQTPEQAQNYIDTVREYYREGYSTFKGSRSEEQQLIAMVTTDEAAQIIDGTMSGLLAIASPKTSRGQLPHHYETAVEKAGITWGEFRSEFEKLLVEFAIITHRLNRDGYNIASYADMEPADKMKVGSVVLSDFLAHNALRFGVDGSGIRRTKYRFEEDKYGEVRKIAYPEDPDKARSDKEIAQNMAELGYRTGIAASPAAKMSPEELKKLRRMYPEEDRLRFMQGASTYVNFAHALEERE